MCLVSDSIKLFRLIRPEPFRTVQLDTPLSLAITLTPSYTSGQSDEEIQAAVQRAVRAYSLTNHSLVSSRRFHYPAGTVNVVTDCLQTTQ